MLLPSEVIFATLIGPAALAFVNGAIVSLFFACCESLRREPWSRLLATAYLLLCILAFCQQLPSQAHGLAVTYWAYMLAVSGSLPVFVYVCTTAVTTAVNVLLGHYSYKKTRSPSATWQRRLRRALRLGDTRILESKLAQVQADPTSAILRSQLVDLYMGLGDHDEAQYHAYALVEMLPHGHAHGFALYRLAQIIAERRKRLSEAQPYLRRIIRLYPRSFFASYARRLVNQYEAYADY